VWGSGGPPWAKTRRFRTNGKERPFASGSSAPKLFSQGANGIYTYSRSGD